MSEKINKVWKTVAQFETYAEADAYRNELAEKHNLIKVKRGRNEYRVKTWDPPPKIKEAKEVKKVKNKSKKGDNNTRRRKHDNKKVRNRSK